MNTRPLLFLLIAGCFGDDTLPLEGGADSSSSGLETSGRPETTSGPSADGSTSGEHSTSGCDPQNTTEPPPPPGTTGDRCENTAPWEEHYRCGDECEGACIDGYSSFCMMDEFGNDYSACTPSCPYLDGAECIPSPFPDPWNQPVCVASRCFLPCDDQGLCPDGMECKVVATVPVCLPPVT